MWLDNDRLHFKSYNEAALKSTVRSQVYIPMEEVELNHDIEGTFSYLAINTSLNITLCWCFSPTSFMINQKYCNLVKFLIY